MDKFTNAINTLLQLLIKFANLVVAGIVAIEGWMRGALGQMGVSSVAQTWILLAVAVVLIVGALRLFGGLIRVAVVLVVLLLAMHIVLPVVHG